MPQSRAGEASPRSGNNRHAKRSVTQTARQTKQRFGLPDGFVPRPQRYERTILLADNIYRLPNGAEFVPCQPVGPLGRLRHLYALLTTEQYHNGRRGSVYVRTDGRIFDYSQVDSDREFFDTGYTMQDLQRTGRYVERNDKEEPPDS